MTGPDLLATFGVTLLLVAFALNLLKKLESNSTAYLLLNITGAGIACLSSYLISFWPFVVLEGVWTISSLVILINVRLKTAA
jgi:hypothetical protein